MALKKARQRETLQPPTFELYPGMHMATKHKAVPLCCGKMRKENPSSSRVSTTAMPKRSNFQAGITSWLPSTKPVLLFAALPTRQINAIRCFDCCGINRRGTAHAQWGRCRTRFPFLCKKRPRLFGVRVSRFYENGPLFPSAHRPVRGSFFLPKDGTAGMQIKGMVMDTNAFHRPAFFELEIHFFDAVFHTFRREFGANTVGDERERKGVGWLHSRQTMVCF